MLLAVSQVNADSVFLVQMFCQMLGAIDRTMLTAGATEREHQVCEPTLQITLHMGICQTIDRVEERQDFPIIFQELDDGSIQARKLLIGLITSGIMR